MEFNDGGLKEINEPHIKLVAFGDVSDRLMDHLQEIFTLFLHSLKDELELIPLIINQRMENPPDLVKGEESQAFFDLMNKIPGNMVFGITDKGLYDYFVGRYVFGYGYQGTGILSTKRFYKAHLDEQKMREVLGKEILKILGLSCGVHCSKDSCILIRHRYVRDLEKNSDVCPKCRKEITKALNYYMSKKKNVI